MTCFNLRRTRLNRCSAFNSGLVLRALMKVGFTAIVDASSFGSADDRLKSLNVAGALTLFFVCASFMLSKNIEEA